MKTYIIWWIATILIVAAITYFTGTLVRYSRLIREHDVYTYNKYIKEYENPTND